MDTQSKRTRRYTETLSTIMVCIAGFGALLVLSDPKITFDLPFLKIIMAGDTFSLDLKGAVITAILIGGWNAIKDYWLPSGHKPDPEPPAKAVPAAQPDPLTTGEAK